MHVNGKATLASVSKWNLGKAIARFHSGMNTHFYRIRDTPPPRQGRSLPLQTIYHWKGNLSKRPIHFRYRQNILISRLYEQFSRNDSAMAPEKFQTLKNEHIMYHFKARSGDSVNINCFAKYLNFAEI